MKTKLITALRTTANALETRAFHYDWQKRTSCNCGSLFCSLTGMSQHELGRRLPKEPAPNNKDFSATWSQHAGYYCPITGMPSHELFKELVGYGLMPSDIHNLEYLCDESVLKKMGVKKLYHNNRDNTIKYMRAWADLLTESGKDDVPPVEHAENRKRTILERVLGRK